jgi:UrcA family protein
MNLTSDKLLVARCCAVALATFTLPFFASVALAADPGGSRLTQTVNFADLNLSHPAGLATLYGRVHSAALKVCAPMESRDLMLQARWNSCVADAQKHAIASIDVPAFSAYYNARMNLKGRELVASR